MAIGGGCEVVLHGDRVQAAAEGYIGLVEVGVGLFADTGIPLLFRSAYKLGAAKERIVCRLAGASNVLDPGKVFNVGLLNHLAATNVLSKNNVKVSREYVGGLSGMTLTMHIGTGSAVVTLPNGEKLEL
jgi:chemotaxis protein CheD